MATPDLVDRLALLHPAVVSDCLDRLGIRDRATSEIVFTIPQAARTLDFSEVTIAKAAAHLERLRIVREVTGKSRNKLYSSTEYLSLLSEGTHSSPSG